MYKSDFHSYLIAVKIKAMIIGAARARSMSSNFFFFMALVVGGNRAMIFVRIFVHPRFKFLFLGGGFCEYLKTDSFLKMVQFLQVSIFRAIFLIAVLIVGVLCHISLALNVEQTYKLVSRLQNKLRTFFENIFDKKFCSLNFISLFRDMIMTITDFHQVTGISRNTVYSWIDRGNLPKGITVAGIGKSKILDVTEEYEHFKILHKAMKRAQKV